MSDQVRYLPGLEAPYIVEADFGVEYEYGEPRDICHCVVNEIRIYQAHRPYRDITPMVTEWMGDTNLNILCEELVEEEVSRPLSSKWD